MTDQTAETLATVHRFGEAFNARDVNAIMALMTDDCVFEDTNPAPDGRRHQGQRAVRAVWTALFGASPGAHFEWEDETALGDKAVVRWRYTWAPDEPGKPGHVRGVDVLTIRDGKISEKLSYVKG